MADQTITIAPAGTTWSGSDVYMQTSGFTRQGYWYRIHEQREHGRRGEARHYLLKLSYYDDTGRLWQHSTLAVCDDFGTLVEVRHG